MLDIAAGHGIFGISVAQAVPQAEVTAIDWRAVLAVAQKNAQAAGIAERYRTIPGSAFEVDWGKASTSCCSPISCTISIRRACVGLLEKARKSLNPKGSAIAAEFVPNEDRVSPPFPAMFAFMMLGSTPHGDAYTARELEEMGHKAGFRKIIVEPVPPTPQSLVSFEQA